MKFCDTHWTMLKAKVDEYGLTQFIAKSGEEAHAKLASQLSAEGGTRDTFDPLLGAHNAIISVAINQTGLELLVVNIVDGVEQHHCPLCYLNQKHTVHCTEPDCKFSYDVWIDHAVKDMVEEAKKLGLVQVS